VKTRTEQDSLGALEVPVDALYGIQTQRAVENFPISGRPPHPDFTWAAVLVKKAAALSNLATGHLEQRLGRAIVTAADEILAEGRWREQFVVDRFQAGAGTSHNMNTNEVLANRANELLGAGRGEYSPVHPNDHVNMSQSSNDTVPTMTRLAILRGWERLRESLRELEEAFAEKANDFDQIVKSGRTHLQDAVPVRLGQEFGAYRTTVGKAGVRLEQAAEDLRSLNLGATALGTGINSPAEYREQVVEELSRLTGWPLRAPQDYFQITQSYDDFVRFSGELRNLAVELTKIANDLRLLSSGPRAGLGDISLPPVQPGSSIMPGKVNPVMAEMLNMVCFDVIGGDLTVSLAGLHGQLDLNVFAPVMAHVLPERLDNLSRALTVFTDRCVRGIEADEIRLADQVARNTSLATALAPAIGYARAATVAKRAVAENLSVREAAEREGVGEGLDLDELLDPRRLTEPGMPTSI